MELFEFDFIVQKNFGRFIAVQDFTLSTNIDFEWNHMRMHH